MKTININNKSVQIISHNKTDLELLLASKQFKGWSERLDPRFNIKSITLAAIDLRHDGGLLFAKLIVDVTDPTGTKVPGIVFMRGDAVAILIILKSDQSEWVVLVEQPRFAAGIFQSLEIPAGMMDDHGDFRSIAIKEIKEETGLNISEDELAYLGQFNPSAGACDETLKLYSCEKKMAEEDILKIHNSLAGAEDENEKIMVKLVKLAQLTKITNDPKALIAYGYYTQIF